MTTAAPKRSLVLAVKFSSLRFPSNINIFLYQIVSRSKFSALKTSVNLLLDLSKKYDTSLEDILERKHWPQLRLLSCIIRPTEVKSDLLSEIESELTVKFLKKGYKIAEVPIDYFPRSFEQGKKIRLSNGLKAIWVIIKYKFIS